MAEIVSLTCSSCGGKLQIPASVTQFAFGYCGTEFTVNRGGGIVSLAPVVDGLKHGQRGVDKTASELDWLGSSVTLMHSPNSGRLSKPNPYLHPSGLGTFLLALSARWRFCPIGTRRRSSDCGHLLLVAAFNGSRKKAQELTDIEQQYAATVSEIDRHKAIVAK